MERFRMTAAKHPEGKVRRRIVLPDRHILVYSRIVPKRGLRVWPAELLLSVRAETFLRLVV